jgi:LmbE family N-acetylglucosaminyl deacetylase
MSLPLRARLRTRLKRGAHRIVFPAVTRGTGALFRLAGRMARPAVRYVPPGGGEQVLVLAPHPDDETLGCGGAIALHSRAGDTVRVVIVTDGGRSRAGGRGRGEIRALRQAEAQAAVARLGPVALRQWNLPEGRWAPEALDTRLAQVLDEFAPTLIYTTSCVDFHPEHRRVAERLGRMLAAGAGRTCRAVRVYELQVPLTPVLANVAVAIAPVAAVKVRALAAYGTQAASFGWLPRQAGYLRRLYGARGPVEVFWELAPAQFVRLMAGHTRLRPRFRGLRLRPFSDMLAWTIGLRARRRLRALAEGRAGGSTV